MRPYAYFDNLRESCYTEIAMFQTVQAIYEKGVLKPLKKIALSEHKKVTLTIIDSEDIPSNLLAEAANKSKSYKFLKRKKEDIYSLSDGKPI